MARLGGGRMNTPPEPAPRETFADWIGRCDDIPDDLTAAVEQDRSPYEVEFKRRVRDHGGHLNTLRKLERFTRERWPRWFEEFQDINEKRDNQCRGLCDWRNGRDLCRFLWAQWLEHLERS